MSDEDRLPQYVALIRPFLEALRKLGGSATVDEFDDVVIGSLGL